MDEFVKKEEKTYIIHAETETEIDIQDANNEPIDDMQEQENPQEAPKKIEVVTGDGNDLDISNVSEYLEVQKPKEENRKGTIIIPEEKK